MTKKMKATTITLSILGAGALALYLLVKSAQVTPTQNFIGEVIKHYNPHLPKYVASEITDSVIKWTDDRNVNLFTTLAIIAQESNFDSLAEGEDGEKGLGQIMPVALEEIKRKYGIEFDWQRMYEIDENIKAMTLYYRYCAMLANNNRFEAISRYNKTTEWWLAKEYANAVLAKRAKIVEIYEKYS